ncbi:hypothetical protein C0V70_05865 [Bacteriovorax stolpii]|uniref:Uncharacterized protein n=1 Tax=Bacteriovorax stolpii TaxID=960 RepID=A0A2K9NQ60_BACTC|nr:hypothetical protein [Bacteriovorax stolpii]AUN97648.1 hypothetical protein C0V70_05865 [Bacteriovorax stolpii]TDP52829.1 hypothetical protein C8D79_2596 [Bacteriovorax stolpii]
MNLKINKEFYRDFFIKANFSSFEVNEYKFELESTFENSIDEKQEFLNKFKKFHELKEDFSNFKYEITEENCYDDMYFEISWANGNCEKCGHHNFFIDLSRRSFDFKTWKVVPECRECRHSEDEDCSCRSCEAGNKNNSTVFGLVFTKDNFAQTYQAIETLYEHYTDVQRYFQENGHSHDLDDVISTTADIAKLDRLVSFKKIDSQLSEEWIDLFLWKALELKKMSFKDFFHNLTDAYTFKPQANEIYKKNVRENGVDWVPDTFLRFAIINTELIEAVEKNLIKGVEISNLESEFLDSDFIHFAESYANIHDFSLELKSSTIENILKLKRHLNDLQTFKAIEKTISGAVIWAKKQNLYKSHLRNVAISYLNDAFNKYDPNGTFNWETKEIDEWELEDKYNIINSKRKYLKDSEQLISQRSEKSPLAWNIYSKFNSLTR